jgi:ribonuclease HII
MVLGVDENGLGSRLGPMTVTAVRIALDREKLPTREKLAKLMARVGIGDSKELCAHGSMGAMEGRVLALLEVHAGITARSLTEFARSTAIETDAELRRDCPTGEASKVCFEDDVALPAFGAGPTDEDREIARSLLAKGFRLDAVRVAVACAGRINLAREAGRSRMDVDLDAMLSLVEALAVKGSLVRASLGKVGARMRYHDAIAARFALVRTESETRERSTYTVASVGELSFVMDGDATEPAISLASMVGKFARELWMHRHNRYWNGAVPGTSPVSGYHDPVTARLVSATALARKNRGIPDRCFER